MPTIRLSDAEIAYSSHGRGDVPVVFLQGVGLAGAAWTPQLEAISQHHRCIAIDNRGIGESRGDTAQLSVDVMARDAWAVLDALGVEKAHLVGHSLGGVIIQRMSLMALARVKSLCFMCSFAGGADLKRPNARLVWYGARSRLGTTSMRKRAFARLILPDAYIRQLGIDACIAQLEHAFGRSLAELPPIADAQLHALRTHDQRNQLARLAHLPCLVLSGKQDPIATHAANVGLARAIGTARHDVWTNASHALPIQLAQQVNQLLRAHLGQAFKKGSGVLASSNSR
jgi:pimeloyl-ACP methyl ester carboxylesterase